MCSVALAKGQLCSRVSYAGEHVSLAGIPVPLLNENSRSPHSPGDAGGQSGSESSIQQGGKGIQRGEDKGPRTHSYRSGNGCIGRASPLPPAFTVARGTIG